MWKPILLVIVVIFIGLLLLNGGASVMRTNVLGEKPWTATQWLEEAGKDAVVAVIIVIVAVILFLVSNTHKIKS